MFWLLLACTGGTGDSETGDSALDSDSAVWGDDEVLVSRRAWESLETGVATGVGWADIDGDGYAELVVAYGNDIQQGPLMVYDNVDGALEERASWQSTSKEYYGHLSVGDVNGDGLPDVAVSKFLGDTGFSDPGGIDVYLNIDGELEPTPSWQSEERFFSFSCALGDVDNDGDLDLAVAVGETYYHEDSPAPSLVYFNDGTGNFGAAPGWTSGVAGHAFDVGWADMDGNGWLDLLMANQIAGHAIYFNRQGVLDEQPAWVAEGEANDFEGNSLDFGDVNGDGNLDLVVTDNNQISGLGTVRIWCGPDFAPCWEPVDTVDYASAVSLEDVDGDGRLDVAVGSWWGRVQVYFNSDLYPDQQVGWRSQEAAVIEGFAWEDVDGSDWVEQTVSGENLLAVPGRGRVLEVVGGVTAGGWASGPGSLEVRYLEAFERDLVLSNWEYEYGNRIYGRP